MATPEVEAAKVAITGPFEWSNLFPTLWMLAIAASGGFVSFYGKVKSGESKVFNIMELLGEVFVSALVGLVTYWICKGFAVNEWLTAAGVAISGHMGTRGIALVENALRKKADTWAEK